MLDKTKSRISDLLKKSVGLPASDSSCCNPVTRGFVEMESPHDAGGGTRRDVGPAKSGCCGGGATIEKVEAEPGEGS